MADAVTALKERLQPLLPGLMGIFVNLPEVKGMTTVESSTKFTGSAEQGSTVPGESTPLHKGRTTMVWQTHIRNDAGKLCAVATQTQTQLVLG